MEPGAGPTNSAMLDAPPPQPPGSAAKAKGNSLVDSQLKKQGAPGAGLGADASSPQVVALQGLAMMEKGQQLLSAALPQLAPALSGLITNLKQVVPQAMSDQLAGVDSSGAGGAPPQPGAAPGPPPPSSPAMAGPPPPSGMQ